jgi:hypothetical protein
MADGPAPPPHATTSIATDATATTIGPSGPARSGVIALRPRPPGRPCCSWMKAGNAGT